MSNLLADERVDKFLKWAVRVTVVLAILSLGFCHYIVWSSM